MSSSLHHERIARLLSEAEELKMDGKNGEAIVLLESVLLEDPNNVPALEEVAENELAREAYERARLAALQAVQLDEKSAIGHAVLGEVCMIQRNWVSAYDHLKIANQLLPNHPDTLRLLGWALFRTGKTVEGIVTLERALNLDPDDSFIMCDLATAHLESGDVLKGKLLLERAADLDPTNEHIRECKDAAERMIA